MNNPLENFIQKHMLYDTKYNLAHVYTFLFFLQIKSDLATSIEIKTHTNQCLGNGIHYNPLLS